MVGSNNSLYNNYIKPIFDYLLAIVLLFFLSPLLIALLIINSIYFRGNPIFIQNRIGKNKKTFNLIKFKTLKNKNLTNNIQKRESNYGNFLRKWGLDELLQLINIIKLEMSFVGPRPLLVEYSNLYTPYQDIRHNVKPGITGLAQINGRNAIEWDQRFELDHCYVRNNYFLLDLKILINTLLKLRKSDYLPISTNKVEPFCGNNQVIFLKNNSDDLTPQYHTIKHTSAYQYLKALPLSDNPILDNQINYILAIKNPEVKYFWSKKLSNLVFATLIDKQAIVSGLATIGSGSVICKGCVIKDHVKIGRHCFISENTILQEGTIVNDFSNIDHLENTSTANEVKYSFS